MPPASSKSIVFFCKCTMFFFLKAKKVDFFLTLWDEWKSQRLKFKPTDTTVQTDQTKVKLL